jgi:NAD-dependent dihydropyrimidine dehydrogenase PreA subunit
MTYGEVCVALSAGIHKLGLLSGQACAVQYRNRYSSTQQTTGSLLGIGDQALKADITPFYSCLPYTLQAKALYVDPTTCILCASLHPVLVLYLASMLTVH